jgi:4-aminobutyrate aminotransferase-like enzyme
VEGQGVTALSPPPIFWARAQGANVWDADGNQYLDLSAAFGVANVGHSHPEIVEALHRQADSLLHGLADVHPSEIKLLLLERLVALFPGQQEARAVLGSSGSDAVEIALKTAMLASGRSGILAFEGAYHGVAFGTLDVTWRADFRNPFRARLPHQTSFARFGDLPHVVEVADQAEAAGQEIGAVIVEPIQGRGGDRIPPRGFLLDLRSLCDERGWLLIVDEIFTGFGRTGKLWASDHENVIPDLLCVGKGLAAGMPLSACLGRAEVMDAWPRPNPQAIHTQTFLGHPASCAGALASLNVLEREGEFERIAALGDTALSQLQGSLEDLSSVREVRGLGLLIAIEFKTAAHAQALATAALEHGLIVLQSGDEGNVVSITPPLCISADALGHAIDVLAQIAQGSGAENFHA